MKTFSLNKMIGSISIMQLLLTSNLMLPCATQSSSMIAQIDLGTANPTGATFDIATLLRSKDELTIKPFENLIAKLARTEKSSCDVETESRFITVFQSITDTDDNEATKSLDAVKALYAIRKALCETGARGTQVPGACKGLVTSTNYDMNKRKMTEQELTIARSGAISACLRKFQEHHYFWTSYSNNRQDANAMSQLIRSDVELRNIIMTYRDFQEAVNKLQDHFQAMNRQSATWLETAGRNAQDLFDLQQETFTKFESMHANASSLIMASYERLESKLDQELINLQQLLFTTHDQVFNIFKDTSTIQDAMTNMKHNIVEIYSGAAAEVAALTEIHTGALDNSMTELNRKSSFVATDLEAITKMAVTLSRQSKQLGEMQSEHLDQLELQHQLASSTITNQQHQNELVEHFSQSVERSLAQIKSLGATVSGITYVLGLTQQYEYIVAVIAIYIAISMILAVLDSTVISQKTASDVKAIYWAIQAVLFLIRKFDLTSKIEYVKKFVHANASTTNTVQTIRWIVFLIAAGSVIALVWNYVKSYHRAENKSDIEKAEDAPIRMPRPCVRICDSQRQRLESIPRSIRHGTAPPGL